MLPPTCTWISIEDVLQIDTLTPCGMYSSEICKSKKGKLWEPAPKCRRVTRWAGHQKMTLECLYEFAVTVPSTLPRDTSQFTFSPVGNWCAESKGVWRRRRGGCVSQPCGWHRIIKAANPDRRSSSHTHTSPPPPSNHILTLIKPFSFNWYVIPLLKTGALALTCNLFYKLAMKKLNRNWHWYVRWLLLAAILVQWHHPVASTKALGLLHQAMHALLYQHTAVAIKTASKVSPFFCRCFVCCCPGDCWGNTE